MIASIIDTAFTAILDDMFEQCEALENDPPYGRTLSLNIFPQNASDNGKLVIIPSITSNLVHNGTGTGSPSSCATKLRKQELPHLSWVSLDSI
jgi:hypothetical protein